MFARLIGQLLRARSSRLQAAPAAADSAGAAGVMALIAAGQAAERQGQFEEAQRCYEDSLAQLPDSAELNAMLGNVLRALGHSDEAIGRYRKAAELKPAFAAAWYNLALTEHELGDAQSAERDYRAALAADPAFLSCHSSLLCLLGMGDASGAGRTPATVLAEHRRWAAQFADPLRAERTRLSNAPDPARRLRVGYVSPDLRRHAIACFVEPILEHRDANACEVICYDNSAGTDATKQRLRGLADGWREIAALGDAAVADLVRADGIDVLIDLAGHTKGNRLLVFARKPAPLQITYLGYPNSTGLDAMDYRLTDCCADPPGMTEAHYVERLLRLPHSMWCYRPFDDMPEVASRGLQEGGVVFGSMNSCLKLNGALVELWAQLLREHPQSRLLAAAVPAGSAQQRLLSAFAAEGIAAGRISCAPRLDNRGFWEMHNRIDIALDAFPMNGGTTTCETLWMGVPVVTLRGETFASRAGGSILTAAGFPEWVAASPADYLRIAGALARDAEGRAALRLDMRRRLRKSPLLDGAVFTRDLEGLYRQAWREWCAGVRRDR